MTEDEYCKDVCGGKCCKVFTKVADDEGNESHEETNKCPNLNAQNQCDIYAQWVNNTCGTALIPGSLNVGNVNAWLAHKSSPQWIKDQCCYAHPELLEA